MGHEVAPRAHEIDLRRDFLGASPDVEVGRLFQSGVAHGGVVEVGDGFVQAGEGEIRHHVLELGESSGGFVHHIRIADVVVADHPVDEVVHPPPFAVERPHAVAPFFRSHQSERPHARKGFGLCAQVGERSLDVVHHLLRLAENGMIDALQRVLMLRAVGLFGEDAKGVVDVSAAVRGGLERVPLHGKGTQNLLDCAFVHVIPLFGSLSNPTPDTEERTRRESPRRVRIGVSFREGGLDDGFHLFGLLFHALDHLQLRARAIHVVAGALDVEVGVAGEIVGEEADADGHRDEARGERELLLFGLHEELRAAAVALCDGLEHIHARIDLGKILLVFGGVGGRGAAHIAEVIKRQAGHDGVQVDDADALAGLVVEHDVVELGVVVGDAFGDFTLRAALQKTAEGVGAGFHEGDFRLHVLGAVEGILLDGGLEGLVTLHRVVEVRDGLVQTRLREVCHHVLEVGEGFAHELRLMGALDLVVGLGAFHEDVHTPPVPRHIVVDGFAIPREDEGERVAGNVLHALCAELVGDVARHAQDVLLHIRGLGEDMMVDALEQVMHLRAAHGVRHLVGIIDVAAPVGATAHKIAINLKRGGNVLQFLLRSLAKLCHNKLPFD